MADACVRLPTERVGWLKMSGDAGALAREPEWLGLSGNDMGFIWDMAGGME